MNVIFDMYMLTTSICVPMEQDGTDNGRVFLPTEHFPADPAWIAQKWHPDDTSCIMQVRASRRVSDIETTFLTLVCNLPCVTFIIYKAMSY